MNIKNFVGAFLLTISTIGASAQDVPVVTLTMPTNGATYLAPANIYLRVEGFDTNGIAATEIFADSNWMGSAKSNVFTMVWTNVPIGTHVILGEALNNLHIWGTSAPVTISVVSNTLPFVSITATDSHASEPGDDVGIFTVSRSGDLAGDLSVFYSVSGTASNGVDFVMLPTSVVIPAGASNATIIVQPIDDTQVEPVESATVTLKENSSYRLVTPINATVYIYDNETNHPPSVQMVNPHEGDSFSDPVNLTLSAEALDVGASVPTVSFYRNGALFGNGIKNPTNNVFSLLWTNVPAGSFSLTAIARDAINQSLITTSAPVNITVTRTNTGPYVFISSPANGKAFTNVTTIGISAYVSTGTAGRVVKQVDFFLDGTLFRTLSNSITSGFFSLQWSNAPAGTYVLTARATDDADASTLSAPNTFSVVSSQFVTVAATDASASEPGTDTGTFTISRTGSTVDPLLVSYRISGTASNGVDYTFLPGSVTIPAGATNTTVIVQPIDDTLVEGTETVTLTVLSSNTATGPLAGTPSSATISIYDNDINQAPTVAIFNPTNGAAFTLPTNILLEAEAHDIDGSISGVAFYRGTNWIGTAYASSATASIFSLPWTNPPIGDFSITARAYDNYQKAATSAPVLIVISGETISNRPVVSISYPTNGSKFHAPTNVELSALAYETNRTITSVEFFANGGSLGVATNNPLSTQPANLFHLTWTNPSPGSYALTAKATDGNGATNISAMVNVTIVSETPTNLPPTVSIQSPTNYSVFYGPTNISITADASDSDGQVSHVYFYKGDLLLGSASVAPYSLVWSNVQPGSYSLIAKAVDNSGALTSSSPVYIIVKSITEFSFVSRSLPIWYVPNVKMTVRLQASPKTNTLSYVVQDAPPAGWTINSVGENGSVDMGGLSVTFGPFNDQLVRTLTYTVTPPSGESGEKHFSGTGTANEVTSPILGVSAITAARPHPADLNPANFFISTNELAAYILAWKRCDLWTISPSPIPLNYLTRAGYIVQGGGTYLISTNYPTPLPPLIWVRDGSSPVISNSLSSSTLWMTNNYGSAIASMPTNYFSNVTFTVSIALTPASGSSAYAVEDRPPEGWTVSNVSDGGFFCPILKKVKWGLFLDNQARTLTYQVTPTTNLLKAAGFSGVASFDGVNVPITGKRYTYLSTGTLPPATLQSIITSPTGDRIITFLGQPGILYRVEGSVDLNDWARLDELLNSDGVLYYTDPASTNFVNRFYRAIPTDGN